MQRILPKATALLLAVVAAVAQEPPSTGPEPRAEIAPGRGTGLDGPRLLEQLGSKDFAVREAATRLLLQDDRVDMSLLKRLMRAAVGEEQRQRLLLVDRHHFLRLFSRGQFPGTGRGFVGIGFDDVTDEAAGGRPAIRVVSTMCGLPGYAYLQPGDLILAINGEPLENSGLFKQHINARKSGDEIELVLRRAGRVRHVRFALADRRTKDYLYVPPAFQLRPAAAAACRLRVRLLTSRDSTAALTVSTKHLAAAPPAPESAWQLYLRGAGPDDRGLNRGGIPPVIRLP